MFVWQGSEYASVLSKNSKIIALHLNNTKVE